MKLEKKKKSFGTAVKCTSITLGICAFAVGVTVVMTDLSFPENGQGGFETPGIPTVTERVVLDSDLSAVNLDAVSETPVQEYIDRKNGIASGEITQDGSDVLPAETSDYNLSYVSYRVKEGDMIGKIAQKFDVSSDSILSLNRINNARGIQIGSYLKIPTMSGILYTTQKAGESVSSITEKFDVDSKKFASVNGVSAENVFQAGSTVFVPDAKLDWATVQEINGDLFKKPVHAKWYKSSDFGWRASPFTGKRSYHSGIDMACPQGTSVYSALNGVVTSTGYSTTYGNFVIVTHHSGYKTLYGHLSAILCVKGQRVGQDTRIGKVGSTGLSTGPHLHFTVYKNNVAVNPAMLWH